MIALAIVLAVLALILLLRVGVTAQFGEDGFMLMLRLGFIKLTILPSKNRGEPKKKKDKKDKKEKKEKEKDAAEKKKGGSLTDFLGLIPAVTKALGRFRRRLLINELTLHFVFAGEDPAATAINYGRSYAVIGAVTPLLERAFRIRKRSITSDVSFTNDKITVFCRATLTIAIWAVIYIACGVLFKFISIKIKATKKRKADEANGKAPDSGTDGDNNAKDPGHGGRKHHHRTADNDA